MKQWIKEFIHNVIIHPLIMFLPRHIGDNIHDINGRWTFKANRKKGSNDIMSKARNK